jgi:pyrophosphate--fructose-6-phosphate 1-phosphotransferase
LHAVYVPEVRIDVDAEARRLKRVMDTHDCVNIFLSEGAGVHDIVAQLEARGESVPRDAFGHVKLDKVQPGAYFAKQFAEKLGALAASCCVETHSRHRRDSCPSDEVVGGFFFEFE